MEIPKSNSSKDLGGLFFSILLIPASPFDQFFRVEKFCKSLSLKDLEPNPKIILIALRFPDDIIKGRGRERAKPKLRRAQRDKAGQRQPDDSEPNT